MFSRETGTQYADIVAMVVVEVETMMTKLYQKKVWNLPKVTEFQWTQLEFQSQSESLNQTSRQHCLHDLQIFHSHFTDKLVEPFAQAHSTLHQGHDSSAHKLHDNECHW